MNLSVEQFTPLIGQQFMVDTQAGKFPLTLSEVNELPRGGRPEQFRTPMLLIFIGQPEWALAQDNYWIEHAALARQMWCIAPVLPPLGVPPTAQTPHYYQVLFS